MKKAAIIIGIFIFAFVELSSQEIGNYYFGFGPYLSMKAGINHINTPIGRKNGVNLNKIPDFGINTFIPISIASKLGITVDAGYSTYSYIIENESNGDKFAHNYSYLTLCPSMFFAGFQFGFSFGYPIVAEYEGIEIPADDLDLIAELRLGYTYPLFSDETGRLAVFISAGYMLNGMYVDFEEDDPLKDVVPSPPSINQRITNGFNPEAASVAIGFLYHFNFPPLEE